MKIKITGPVKRNGKVLPLDETVSMPDADAQALINAGAAEPVGAKAKAGTESDGDKATTETEPDTGTESK